MNLRDSAAQARALGRWSGIPAGTRVVVRRDNGTRFDAITRSAPYMLGGIAVVDTDGAWPDPSVQALSRVSLAGPTLVQAPTVTVGAVLDPPPPDALSLPSAIGTAAVFCALAYFLGIGLMAIGAAVLP